MEHWPDVAEKSILELAEDAEGLDANIRAEPEIESLDEKREDNVFINDDELFEQELRRRHRMLSPRIFDFIPALL